MNTIYTDVYKITMLLADKAVCYRLTKEDLFEERETELYMVNFMPESRYSMTTFYSIMPDSGAAGVSTAGHPQFQALQQKLPSITLDRTTAGKATIRFGSGNALESIGTTTVPTPLGPIDFHVIPADTPFLLCLQDMDRLGIKFDNLQNYLQQGDLAIPVIHKWGHPWLELTIEKNHGPQLPHGSGIEAPPPSFWPPVCRAAPQSPAEGRTSSRDQSARAIT
jgi:hypothetical protein